VGVSTEKKNPAEMRIAESGTPILTTQSSGLGSTAASASIWQTSDRITMTPAPISADQALSDAERTTANNWIDATLRSRLNDPATGAIILVMQRLHELDPTGFLLEQEPGVWTHVRIALEAEEDETWTFPISGKIVMRKAGEVLMPERFPPATVEQLRSRRLVFAGQYQQRPAPVEGNLIAQ
jgi:hypothetical protein